MWAYPREQSAKEKMRSCFEEQSGKAPTNLRTHDYANELHERFSAEKMYKKFVDNVLGFDSSLIETQQEEETVLEFE